MREVKLPSGAVLKLHPAPFADAKALFQAASEEGTTLQLNMGSELGELVKNLLLKGVSSKKIEAALIKCMEKSLYDGGRISDETFEPVDKRQDYLEVCYEVMLENILPFTKGLYAKYRLVLAMVQSDQA